MNNAAFGKKTIEKVRKNIDVKFATTERRRITYLVSEPNYHTKKCFNRRFISNSNEKN